MSNYPYCVNVVVATEGNRPRPESHTIMKCTDTGAFFMQHVNGRVYPLSDRTDPDSDVANRVID